ncbi:Txe/YoeB family addiction module toxin [Candidatus Gracilibacteria bacterium]|nr:Txe/YoeB family addiction module toxin [Candidatus Gracilibacteria bacterium]
MRFKFENKALKDFKYWKENHQIIYKKILRLLKSISHNHFEGIGKPEPLKENLSGWWSRRINREHRLIYKIEGDNILILSCRYHY